MAMTNSSYKHNDSNAPQATNASPKHQYPQPHLQPPAAMNTNTTATATATTSTQYMNNYAHLSPIFEGEIFPSPPTNTISPSLSHHNIDPNHVVLFHSNNGDIKTPNQDSASPTTSISSSNSSNTPTPTTYHNNYTNSNSLFNIPCTNNHPPCIPSVGLMHANISKTSSSSSSSSASPSPSLDTTVSPVTKMDLFRDLKVFEDIDTTNEHNSNDSIDYLTGDNHCNGRLAKYNGYNDIDSPLNSNSLDHKLSAKVHKIDTNGCESNKNRNKKKKKHRHHRKKKKRRRKSDSSDSDSELQKKCNKIRDKIKTISVRVPGDPNGLYKYWKQREKEREKAAKKNKKKRESLFPMKTRTRDRLNSYPPNQHVMYTLSSPSSSQSNRCASIPPLINSSQSCSDLLENSIIIHTPKNDNSNGNVNENRFSVLGLNKYYQNKKRKKEQKKYKENNHVNDSVSTNRVRMNSFPPYMNSNSLSISIERVSETGGDDSKNDIYLNGYYGCESLYYDYDHEDVPTLPLESLSQPNPVIQSKETKPKRPRKNIPNVHRYNIHPSMQKQHMKSTKMTGNLVDL